MLEGEQTADQLEKTLIRNIFDAASFLLIGL